MFVYLARSFVSGPVGLTNTAGLMLAGAAAPLFLAQVPVHGVFLAGLAVFSMNTPACTLLSGDPMLERAVRVLPAQLARVWIPYGALVCAINVAVYFVYIISWNLAAAPIGLFEVWSAALLVVQSALLSVLMEWRFPVRGWKTESDLWRHPRKYVVPASLLLIAAAIETWPEAAWILAGTQTAEFSLLLTAGSRQRKEESGTPA